MAIFQSITIRQIAESANVSIATVSRALNGTGPVKKETMDRIQKAMENLGLKSIPAPKKTAKVILASFPNLSNPFNADIIRGISDAAARFDYDVVYYANENYTSALSYRFIEAAPDFCDGLIVLHSVPDHQALLRIAERVPVVMCSEHISHCAIPYVAIDDYASACTAVNYLISTGRKRIACINSSLSNNYAVFRERGYRACLEKAGFPIREDWILHLSDINFELAAGSITTMLESEDRPDAFFCVSDVFAAAAIKVSQEHGLSIPADIAVIGFDDIDLAIMTRPTITTIRQPTYQLGWQSCNQLIGKINNPNISNGRIILNTDLVVRGST